MTDICDFEVTTEQGVWVCKNCRVLTPEGRKYTNPPTRSCPGIGRVLEEDQALSPQRPPSLARQAWNLARSLTDFVVDGCKTVTQKQYEARLEICDGCDHRRNNRCMKCGCRLSLKAQGRAFTCPEGKWPSVERPSQSAPGAMKVVFFSHALGRGGAERWLVDVATGLSREQFDVTIVLDNGYQDPALMRRASAVRIVPLTKWDESESVDAMVCWSRIPPEIQAEHTVFCLHGAGPFAKNMAAAVSKIPGVHLAAVSQVAADVMKQYGPVEVIYNGCPSDRAKQILDRNEVRRKYGIWPEALVVGFLGRLAAVKRPHLVARAVARLRKRGLRVRSMFVGDYTGQHRSRFEQIRRLDPYSVFTGPQENVGDYLAAMDVMMLPSQTEGFSLAMIETWMAGVPVVSTPVGAVPELENEHGSLVVRVPLEANDDVLANSIQLATSQRHKAAVTYAKRLACREYTLAAMIRRWEKYLHSL